MLEKLKAEITVIAAGLMFAASAFAETATTNSLVIHADAGTTVISKNIYGQFSEHLGHRSEEHTSELQSLRHLVCRLLLEKNTKHDTSRHPRHCHQMAPPTERAPSRR